jgi:hypothetical protein
MFQYLSVKTRTLISCDNETNFQILQAYDKVTLEIHDINEKDLKCNTYNDIVKIKTGDIFNMNTVHKDFNKNKLSPYQY